MSSDPDASVGRLGSPSCHNELIGREVIA